GAGRRRRAGGAAADARALTRGRVGGAGQQAVEHRPAGGRGRLLPRARGGLAWGQAPVVRAARRLGGGAVRVGPRAGLGERVGGSVWRLGTELMWLVLSTTPLHVWPAVATVVWQSPR